MYQYSLQFIPGIEARLSLLLRPVAIVREYICMQMFELKSDGQEAITTFVDMDCQMKGGQAVHK
jgi:hypothetical protein